MIDDAYITKLKGDLSDMEMEMSRPEVSSNRTKFKEITIRYAHQKKILVVADRLHVLRVTIAESDELLADSDLDPELAEMATEEKTQAEAELPAAEQALKVALLPPDSREGANVIMEIRAGTGGDEAALFAGDLYRMYTRFAESNGWKVEPLDASESEVGGYKEVTLCITGDEAFRRLQFESGVHRVQRIPATESQGRIHTSAATVAVLAEAEEVDLVLKNEDLRFDVFRSSGPGGQSVNTTDSAVRVTHIPTGEIATCQDEKSQHRNKEKALRVLRARILDRLQREEAEKHASERRSQIGSGDRSERIRTYNFPQNRVSDHRINLTLHSLDKAMEGDIGELADALYTSDIEARMKVQLESAGKGS